MTSRRAARGGPNARGGRAVNLDGITVPADLLDPHAPAWRSPDALAAWLTAHDLGDLAPFLRTHTRAHPGVRRNAAAERWAERHRVYLDDKHPVPRASWHRLRAAGLIA